MDSHLSAESKLADWVTNIPYAAPILERYGLDYCCGGQRSLASACGELGISAAQVLTDIQQVPRSAFETGQVVENWSDSSLTALCDHIENTHHRFLREQLPRLGQLLTNVLAVHGSRHPELASLNATFLDLVAELTPHLLKEERILFPAIRRLEAEATLPSFPFGSVNNPINVMQHEHDVAGNLLHEMRRLTNDYELPADACETWKQLLNGLVALERDLFQHIHKENNLLFPAAAQLERTAQH